MKSDTIIVLTGRTVESMVNAGGSQAWRLVADHVRRMEYIVCTRNNRPIWGEGAEEHRSAFLVAKIRDVIPSPEEPQRWMVRFSEYARIKKPEVWRKGDRNPIRYGCIAELGIDVRKLRWERMPDIEPTSTDITQAAHPPRTRPLTIMEAKHGLAMAFDVPVEAVEITIRA